MKKLFCIAMLFSSVWNIFAQVKNNNIDSSTSSVYLKQGNLGTQQLFRRKGNFIFYWGYNRSAYTKSDIHFTGDGYHFSIYDVEATDAPTKEFATYVKPNTFSIPQYNYRLGYFLTDKTFVSIGEDHMKYEIKKQATRLSGSINSGNNAGEYDNVVVLVGEGHLSEDELTSEQSILDSLPKEFVSEFEHCDGLNDVSLEFGLIEQIWISENAKHALSVTGTIGSGIVIPDTEAEVLGQTPYHNQKKKTYHLAGYSFSSVIGLQFDFFRHFFLQSRLKGGYINLPDIKTSIYGGKASQHFGFIEPMLVFGWSFSLEEFKKNRR